MVEIFRRTFRLDSCGSTANFLHIALVLVVLLTWPISLAAKLTAYTCKSSTSLAPNHVFIFGLGYTGLALASSIKSQFPDCIISGTCRSIEKAENLKKFGIQPFIFDPDTNEYGLSLDGKEALRTASHIVSMIPPISDFDKDPVLQLHKQDILNNIYSTYSTEKCQNKINVTAMKNETVTSRYDGVNDDIYEDDINGYEEGVMQNRIDENIDNDKDKKIDINPIDNVGVGAEAVAVTANVQPAFLWLGYVSTTGVYGDHNGEWVTEQSLTLAPPTSKAFHRIIAENDWLALRNKKIPDSHSDSTLVCTNESESTAEMVHTNDNISTEGNVRTASVYPHVFRLGGIYGPGRSALDTVKKLKLQKKSLVETTEIKEIREIPLRSNGVNMKRGIDGDELSSIIIGRDDNKRENDERKQKNDEIDKKENKDEDEDEEKSRRNDKIVLLSPDKEGVRNWVSRIHVSDICNAIITSMLSPVKIEKNKNTIYNVVDDQPESREIVMNYANNLLVEKEDKEVENLLIEEEEKLLVNKDDGNNLLLNTGSVKNVISVKSDITIKSNIIENIDLSVKVMSSERSKRRMSENKRVSNAHLKESLGYVLKYPTYKDGIRALFFGCNDPFE